MMQCYHCRKLNEIVPASCEEADCEDGVRLHLIHWGR
jgi:hypothetical protein